MRITFVKKIKADGTACRKCSEVEQRLNNSGYREKIDRVVIADERYPDSEGMQLARRHGVDVAPFFLVEGEDGSVRVFTVYFRFVKEVLEGGTTPAEEIADIMDRNPDLDLL